jgi:hypothetical protein
VSAELGITIPDYVRPAIYRYRDILATIPPRAQTSTNTLREAIDAAQLTTFERGELFRFGSRHGYLEPLMLWEPSTAPAAKGRYVRCYRRTSKPVRGAA